MLPAVGDTIEVKPPKAKAWVKAEVTRTAPAAEGIGAGLCIGKPRTETWFSESVEGELWRIPAD